MRHLFGIILGIALAAALFFGGGWGSFRLLSMANTALAPHLTSTRALTSMAAVAGTGILLGVLMAAPRVSPLATALPGITALGLTAAYMASPHRALDLIPMRSSAYGLGAEALLRGGIYALLGAAMLVPLFVPSRWRRQPVGDEEEPMGMAAASSYLS